MKANEVGTGFVKVRNIPLDIGTKIKVSVRDETSFFATICEWSGKGFYIPKKIVKKNNLIGKEVSFQIHELDGFYATVQSDNKVTLPISVVEKFQISKDDVLEIELYKKYQKSRFYSKVFIAERKNKITEYLFTIHSKEVEPHKKYRMKILRKLQALNGWNRSKNYELEVQEIFEEREVFKLNSENALILHGKCKKLITPQKIKFNERLAYFLGAYFADGTRKGNYWRINASTPEQARFYREIHKNLCKDVNFNFKITYTRKSKISDNEVRSSLFKRWKLIPKENLIIYIRDQEKTHDIKTKRTKYGSLSISDYRYGVLVFYQRLLDYSLKMLFKSKNKMLMLNFIFGVLEGDGSASSQYRGHIRIYTNDEQCKILHKILKESKIKHRITKGKGKAISIRIGALEILRNFSSLKDNLFKFYPKRRKMLFNRFRRVGAVKFILGKQDYASSWVKAWLKNEDILNENYQLTSRGKKIRNDLLEMMKEVGI